MKITKAEFVKSFAERNQLRLPYPNQIAFAGRSNVGKSSILNSLLNRKNLAKTSSTPGKTRMVNVFNINDTVHFVDLPGFGYAKVPKSMQKSWKDLVEGVLLKNTNLKGLVLIIDVRRGIQQDELTFLQWLTDVNIPVILVANKTDKLKKQQLKQQLSHIQKALDDCLGPKMSIIPLPYSAKTGVGKRELWREILSLTHR